MRAKSDSRRQSRERSAAAPCADAGNAHQGVPRVAHGVTIWIAAAALLCWLVPSWSAALELQRSASGQLWRLMTGHLLHFDFAHLAVDTAVLLCLGLACEHRDRRRTLWTFVLAPLAVSLSVLWFAPGIESYRGLSGIDSALFALLATLIWQRRARHSRGKVLLVLLPASLFIAKLAYEVIQGRAIFLPDEGLPQPVPVAHLIGALCGLCVGLAPADRPAPRALARPPVRCRAESAN